MLRLSQRTLLADGTSVVDVAVAAEQLLKTGEVPEYIRVPPCRDATEFEFRYGVNITGSEHDPEVVPKYQYTSEDYDRLFHLLGTSCRGQTSDKEHLDRLEDEMAFFVTEGHLDLLLSIKSLIDSFKSDGVVWGVGRGSSCASYVLYLLEVHDINPISNEINFTEFSKQ